MNISTARLGGTALLLSASVLSFRIAAAELEEIIITSHPLSGEGLSQAVELLEGAELQRMLDSNIGSTLSKLPGIQSSSFGKAVGRPVIHGLAGPRVKIMEDRIDTLDLSVTSGDHAVTIDPFVAEKVEVLKGASTLLYGSGAIGGVVDIHTGRIPHNVPEKALSGGIETRFDSNTDGNATALKLNGGFGQFAWHLDGSVKDGDAYEIPGFVESGVLRALEAEEAEEEGEEGEQEQRDILAASQFETDSVAFGASYIADWGFIGLAVSHLSADYGLPGGHGHEEGEEEEEEEEGNPTLELEQDRIDVELGIENPFSMFSSLNVRLGINDYEHQEIEPDGIVATNFENKAWEARAELVYDRPIWRGVFGTQLSGREFSAIGEEAFIAPVDSDEQSLFWLAERSLEQMELELGLRLGRVSHDPSVGISESFDTYAASAGLVIPLSAGMRLGVLFDYSSRAPVAEELYSNGPHLVSNTFELGNADLNNEDAINIAATLEYSGGPIRGRATVYYTRFSDFIFQQRTGAEQDGLPEVVYQQSDADFYGIDAELTTQPIEFANGELSFSAMFDVVNAKLDVEGNDNLPRISPMRYGLGLNAEWGSLRAHMNYLRVDEQVDTAILELPTDAYNDLSVSLSYEMELQANTSLRLFVNGKNLSDDEQRHHTSFIKDVAPAPGRTIEVGVGLEF